MKHLILFYLPGLGGHHLANLISLSGDYVYSVDYSLYGTKWNHGAAHFEAQASENTIIHNHFGSADDDAIFDCLQHVTTQCLVITLPVANQLAQARINYYNKINFQNFHFYHDIEKIYKQQHLSKLYKPINPHGWVTVESDWLFDREKITCLVEKLEQDLNIIIPDHDLVCTFHNHWLDSIEAYVKSQS